ncbi:hypothetical protein [Fimbriiglobus ruber]|uniref:Uncharacterized protein n=1 Tax=Fimbriiglobus ruber TaxID=1908690 RepID=A0A225DEM0_9BACT|nr:hypothetical protein [Fimbriiglobus ruber]OWK36968.1 hypothetical protein FRUB_07890 [Fimbriiglobus ruber]
MPELTLEALAARVAELERKLSTTTNGVVPPTRDWRSVVGMFDDSEFMAQVIAEGQAIREAQRKAAREGRDE